MPAGRRLPAPGPRRAYDARVTADDVVLARPPRATGRWPVVAWALWDWGSAAFNAVVVTFVFTRWITSESFVDPAVVAAAAQEADGGPATDLLQAAQDQSAMWLGWGLAAAGVVVALLAPVLGARADDGGRRRRWLAIQTTLTVLVMGAMVLVVPDPDRLTANLVLGIALLAVGSIVFELAGVNYNAMLSQVSTPATVGRVSGLGWGAGYLGGIVLLLVLFVGFINPEVGWFGVTGEDGLNIRVAVLVSAIWFAVFAIPVLVAVPEVPASPARARLGVADSYRQLFRDIAALWRDHRSTLAFLGASAVYRDGLAGVFTFGAVIASVVFGFSASEVIVFAIAANVTAGLSTIVAGLVDDRLGPKRVILVSLAGLVVCGLAVFVLHDGGRTAFWVFGLALCLFVGPAQSASRSLLSRQIPAGRESEIFGLYATTGRAASFLAPFAFSTAIGLGGGSHWGVVGIVVVLAIGLALLVPVRVGARPDALAGSARVPGAPGGDAAR